jgi:arsenite methyltransferase
MKTMSLKAKMFNRKASKGKPDEIMKALDIKSGMKIADLGSGGGFFTMKFAEAVGDMGKVYALDTDQSFLDFIKRTAGNLGFKNIQTILINEDGFKLPESVDMIFCRNVFHHLGDRVNYFKKLRAKMKLNGVLVIIEHKKRSFGHFTSQEVVIEEMKEAGYKVKKKLDVLPEQSFTIFNK